MRKGLGFSRKTHILLLFNFRL